MAVELSLGTGEGLWLLRSLLSLSFNSNSHSKLGVLPKWMKLLYLLAWLMKRERKSRGRHKATSCHKKAEEKPPEGVNLAACEPTLPSGLTLTHASLSCPTPCSFLLPLHIALQQYRRSRSFKLPYVHVHPVSSAWNTLPAGPPLAFTPRRPSWPWNTKWTDPLFW